ncbi:MAG: hypothetical protein EXX96DRAFT_587443 [Benjaminiella poitrasii]|nr:MAG: hypothetical protein EXX96DRAFT_587443 [Benjaminiella poitrasii]
MFLRSRKNSTRQSKEIITSSLSSGSASIINSVKQEEYDDKICEDEIIDLQQDLTIESMSAVIAAAVQLSSSAGSPSSLSLGNASIVKPSTTTTATTTTTKKRKFSSRLFFPSWNSSNKQENQENLSPFSSSPTTPGLMTENSSSFESSFSDDDDNLSSPRTSSSVPSHINIDDGREELLYRGIQIKEIKSTLKPFVITDEARFPLPEVKLERPGFARINY